MSSPGDLGPCQTSGVGEGVRPVLGQCCAPGQVSPGLRQELIDCWITVSNAGGAVGFPFPPVGTAIVSPVADELIASLSPDRRLLIAVAGLAMGCQLGPSSETAQTMGSSGVSPSRRGLKLLRCAGPSSPYED